MQNIPFSNVSINSFSGCKFYEAFRISKPTQQIPNTHSVFLDRLIRSVFNVIYLKTEGAIQVQVSAGTGNVLRGCKQIAIHVLFHNNTTGNL